MTRIVLHECHRDAVVPGLAADPKGLTELVPVCSTVPYGMRTWTWFNEVRIYT